jgi:signal transduction histidine kinase
MRYSDEAKSFISYSDAKVVASIFALISLLITFLSRDNLTVRTVFGDISVTVASCLGAAGLIYALLNAGKEEKSVRLAFALMASGLMFNVLAEIIWTTLDIVLHGQPFPSLADGFYLIYYPLFTLGVMFLPADRLSPRERNKMIIDIIIIIASAVLIFWDFIIVPILAKGEESTLALSLSVAYPILDIVLLFALLELLYRRWNSLHLGPMLFLLAAIVVAIASDIAFSMESSAETYVSGGFVDLGFVLSYLFFGLAGICQAEEWRSHPKEIFKRTRYDQSPWTRYLPYCGLCAAYLLLVWNSSHLLPYDSSMTVWGIGGIIGLVLIRQNMALNENSSLYQETKSAEEALRKARDDLELRVKERTSELKARNAEMERFIYTVSHELRSPLISASGLVGLLIQDLEKGDEKRTKTDLKLIDNAVTKMDKLLSEILELSRVGRVMNLPEDVPFDVIVKEALDREAGDLKSRGFEVSVANDLPMVHVDRTRIMEVLVNLLENSIKYIGTQSRPRIEIGHRIDGKERILYVRDNGIGIDPSQYDKIFGLFYKVDGKSEGTGVGLALVKRIIEVHGGHIWIESELGQGCTVCFTLPLANVG